MASSTATFSDNAPSWEILAEMVAAQRLELGMPEPDHVDGPTNAFSLRRTFGQPGEPRVKFYRDHASWCPYCEKVWLQLEEKKIPYIVEKINMSCYGEKPRSFLAIAPGGSLPVMERI
jgi:glutathione S-transferase